MRSPTGFQSCLWSKEDHSMGGTEKALTIQLIGRDDGCMTRMEALAGSVRSREGATPEIRRGRQAAEDAEIILMDLDSLGESSLREISALRKELPHRWIVVTYQN